MDTDLLIWNRVVSWTGIFTNIISDRDPKFTSALWTDLHQMFGTKLFFSTAYHSKTDGLAQRMIQTLEDMRKDSFARTFVIKALHGQNAVEVELSEELSNKHPTFPVSLIKPYKSSDSERFPLSNKVSQAIPPIESSGIKNITKVPKERKLRTNKVREYTVRYSDPTCEDEWLAEKDIP
ncbi:hypothetical protein O181_130025 [Austropuccinia psidii MF-1]|uniref:Integrase catalytic domain-containing protein n=1 Tax=Austropuccinia psidii MF-1 TaxID=1389203 RepID=A0A9Q3KY78_9BASI|nr:hypothetical protein [Austropuccinia psidii MF-1]